MDNSLTYDLNIGFGWTIATNTNSTYSASWQSFTNDSDVGANAFGELVGLPTDGSGNLVITVSGNNAAVSALTITAGTNVQPPRPPQPNYSSYHSYAEMYNAPNPVLHPVIPLTQGPKFHWFGYYLHDLIDSSGRYLLACEMDFENRTLLATDTIKVGMIDLEDNNKWIELGTSGAFSWLQGCFVQWRPGSDTEVCWNDREVIDGKDVAVTRVLDIETQVMRTLPKSIDEAITPDGNWALCSDFSRTWIASRAYGYPGIENDSTNVKSPSDAGIWKMNMNTGATELLVSLADLLNLPGNEGLNPNLYRYVAHYDWSPDGTRFSAYYRGAWPEPTRVYTIAADGSDIRLLSSTGASHWAWRDNNNIMIWMHDNGTDVGYEMFTDDGEGKPKSLVWAAPNGHQTYIPGTHNEWMVTDTYPLGGAREQILYLVHLPTQLFIPLARLHSPSAYTSDYRCDLHPNVSRDGKKVFIEATHGGNGRQVYMVDIGEIISEANPKIGPLEFEQINNGAVMLRWQGIVGYDYQVEYSFDLVNWLTDLPNSLITGVTSAGELSYEDTVTHAKVKRFYRIRRIASQP